MPEGEEEGRGKKKRRRSRGRKSDIEEREERRRKVSNRRRNVRIGKPWYFDIKQYFVNKEYPPGISDNDKMTLRRLATSFFVSGTILYKRNHDMTLL